MPAWLVWSLIKSYYQEQQSERAEPRGHALCAQEPGIYTPCPLCSHTHTHTWVVEPALLNSHLTSSHRLQEARLKDKTGIFGILTIKTLHYKVNIAKVWSCTNLKDNLMFYRTGHLQIKSCFKIYIKNQRSAKISNQTHSECFQLSICSLWGYFIVETEHRQHKVHQMMHKPQTGNISQGKRSGIQISQKVTQHHKGNVVRSLSLADSAARSGFVSLPAFLENLRVKDEQEHKIKEGNQPQEG